MSREPTVLIRLLLGAFLLPSLLSACGPRDIAEIESHVRQILPANDAEPRLVAPSNLFHIRSAPTVLEALLVEGAAYRHFSQNGVVAVTNSSIYYMYWNRYTSRYTASLIVPLTSLVSVEAVSSPLFPPDYAVDIETREPRYTRQDGSTVNSRYRISIRTDLGLGSRDQSRALCQEIANRRSQMQPDGAAPMVRCDSFLSRGRWDN